MKKLYLTLISALLTLCAFSQDIVYAEYFWDTDPGLGMGVGTPIGPGQLIDTDLSVSSAGLSLGHHWLYVRTKNDDGEWSIPIKRKVYFHEIVEAEYFWDADPGFGNGQTLALATTDVNINESFDINTSGLSGGRHQFGIRMKGKGGRWSPVTWTNVFVTTEFSDGEYFWDLDPGMGNAVSFDVPNEQSSVEATVPIETDGLMSGWHTLYTRMRGVNSSFGPNFAQRIYVAPKVVGGEYFWDTDPGVGNGTPLGTLSIGTSAQVCDEVSTIGLAEGIHYLYVRSVSEENVWSIPTRIQMTVTPNEIIVGCPGDFDRSGIVAAGDLLAFLGGFGSSGDCTVDLNGDFVVDTSDLLIFLGLFGSVCE